MALDLSPQEWADLAFVAQRFIDSTDSYMRQRQPDDADEAVRAQYHAVVRRRLIAQRIIMTSTVAEAGRAARTGRPSQQPATS